MNTFDAALSEWQCLLGCKHVIVAGDALAAAQTATFATSARIPAILRPASRDDVRECLLIADRHRVPVYPISRGKNWGYGSRTPARDGTVLLDLSRMDRILDWSEKLAYITVEPGVTFRQVVDFLREQGSNLMLNTTGGPFDGSVLGNLLERGIGTGPYSARAQYACDFEAVLPSGDVIHTGFGRFDTSLAPLSAWGVGPELSGLFTQSNFAVITRITLWLAPKPAYFQTFHFTLDTPSRLGGLLDALRDLKLSGPASAHYSLWNDYKLLATLQQYPWQEADGQTPLPEQLLAELREKWEIARWNGFGAIYSASRAQSRAERSLIAQALGRQVDELSFMSDTHARALQMLRLPLRLVGFDATQATIAHERTQSLWFGAEHNSVTSAYWRKKAPPPEQRDLDADGCGVIWCSVCVPFDGVDARAAIEIVEQTAGAYRFEPHVALLCPTPRVLHVIASIIYDRYTQGEDERARACHDIMIALLTERGYLPYRLGHQSMGALPAPHDDSHAVRERLKRAFDPNGIIAPGRYEG